MRKLEETGYPLSVRENVPEEWQEAVLTWVNLRLDGFIPSVYLDHDFIEWVAGSETLTINLLNPSYAFFRLLPLELVRAFRPGDAVSISFDTKTERVLFLGEGQWGLAKDEEEETVVEFPHGPFGRNWWIGLWPGLEDFDL